jgi:hypothetical protein
MNRLLDIGFEPSGHWLLAEGKLVLELSRNATQRNILYAFACDGQVKYVGKSTRMLSKRLSGYKNPSSTQSTNIKNNQLIKAALAKGLAVEILALPDSGLLHYGVFHLNLAAGLEDDIIRRIDPEWNGAQQDLTKTASTLPFESMATEPVSKHDAEPPESKSTPVIHQFKFVLQPTYSKMGFFNVSVDSERYVGADGEKIELFLGKDVSPTLGVINRRANPNGTPRIMGGPRLRDWFQNNATPMQSIEVQVMSPVSIRMACNQRQSL